MNVFIWLGTLSLRLKAFLLIMILFFLYGLSYHFFDGVLPIHEWRKTDSLSIAWNYYKGAPFLEPETNLISYWNNRNAAAEFPLIYFLVGNLWKIFGPHEWIAKLVSFSVLISSLVLFSSVVNHFLKSQLKTLIFIGIIFSSPVLLFYSDTLIPNVFSFSLVLISGFFLFRFVVYHKKWALVHFTIFITTAVMIKVTVLISLLTFAGAATLYYFFSEKNLFTKHLKLFLLLFMVGIIVLLSTYLWYSYAVNYNSFHHSTLFSTTIRPIWEVDVQRQKEIWNIIWKYQINSLYSYWTLVPTILMVCYLAIRNRISPLFYYLIAIGLIGSASYFILWFWVFDVHDYYLIEVLFLPLIFFFIVLKYLKIEANNSSVFSKYISISLILLIFLQAISYTQISFGKNNFITKNTFLVSQYVKGNWGYFHWYHNEHLKKLQLQKTEVQQIIRERDTVLCLTDPSPNVHLFTIGRIGYTQFSFLKNQPPSDQIPSFIKKGVRYLLVVGNEPIDTLMNQFTIDTLYAKNAVFIFDLKSFK